MSEGPVSQKQFTIPPPHSGLPKIESSRPRGFGSFAFTYNKNYKKTDEMKISDYDPVLELLRKYGDLQTYSFEIGSVHKRLHVHGIVELHEHINKWQLRLKGFIGKFVEIYDYTGWKNYIFKEDERQNRSLFMSTETHEFMSNCFPPVKD